MDFNNNERNNQDPNKRKKNKTNLLICLMAALFAIGLIFFLNSEIQRNTEKEITYTKFIEMLKKDQVKKVTFQSNMIVIEPKTKEKVAMLTVTYYTGYVNDEKLVQDLLNKYGVEFTAEIQSSSGIMDFLLSYILPIAGLWILLWFFMRSATKGGGIMGGVGKSNAKMYVEKKTGVTFKDVAGEEEAKESLTELVDFLKNPDKYKKIGARLPKGALLVGPPGTGKTLLAKALAGEAGVPFFSLSGSDFVEMFVGVGASRVRDLFKQATSMAPCIIFIDEIDAVARRRGSGLGGGHDEREQTLNQMLVEMDGFGINEGIIVMAATNRVDILDPAILRPGRFDRRIHVGLPDVRGREEILKVHAKNKPLADDVNLEEIARTTAGFAGADLENLLNEAAICAARENRPYLMDEDIRKSFIKVGIGAEKKSRIISEKDKRVTAYHEAGHAILFHVLPDVGPVYTVSVIPTGQGAGGYTMPLPEKDEMYLTKGKMLQDIVVCLGGRIAESLVFDDVTTGAVQDIRQATERARDMVTKYGFSDELGMINYSTSDDEVFIGREIGHAKNFSEGTAAVIDQEVKRIIESCREKATKILKENRKVLDKLAELLIEKERIGQQEFEALFEQNDETIEEM